MKKLFLTSYFANTKDLFKNFTENELNIDLKGKEILFIPTASIVEEVNFYVEEAKIVFKEFGMKINVLELTKVSEVEAKNKINLAEIIYFSGGNTFFLLQELKRKNLVSLIKQRVEEGMIYIGESAGAIISSENIFYVEDMDNKKIARDLKGTEALNLINFYPIVHYNEFPFAEASKIIEKKYEKDLNFAKINNKQVIVINDKKIMII